MTTVFADEYGYSAGDATSALQAAIDDPSADRIVVRNQGSPWLISEQIELRSNKEIVFEEGVVVQAKPGSFVANDKAMIVGLNIENVKLIGEGSGANKATLKMNKEEYTSNQFGHVVSLLGVDGYEVSGLKLTGGGGDGLHLAGGAFGRPQPNVLFYSANGLVENITSDDNRRQALSIDSAKNLVVRNSTFTNTDGTEPSAGINLEPTWDFESLENVRIENVDINGNAGNGIQMTLGNLDDSSPPISVDFDNVTLNDSKANAIFITGKYIADGNEFGSEFKGQVNQNSPSADINGTINFNNVNISNADAIASGNGGSNPEVYVFIEGISGDRGDPENLAINFNSLNVSDPLDTSVRTTPIFIQGLGGDNNPQEIGNLSFNDVTIQGNYSVDAVRADLLRDDGNLNNISGDITVFDPNGTGVFIANEDRAKNLNLNVTEGNGQGPASIFTSSVVEEPAVEDSEVAAEPLEAEAEAEVVDSEVAAEPEAEAEAEVVDSEVAAEPEAEAEAEIVDSEAEAEVVDSEDSEVAAEPEAEAEAEVVDSEVTVEPEAEVMNSEPAAVVEDTEVAAEPIEVVEPVEDINPVQNSSFTDNLTGWNPVGGSISTVERSPGDSWVKIDAPIGGISQDVSGLIEPGSNYQVEATTQLPGSGNRGYIGVRFSSEANELVSLKYTPVSGSTATEQQLEFTAPDNFARADLFAFKNNGSGSLFVDDFSIDKQ